MAVLSPRPSPPTRSIRPEPPDGIPPLENGDSLSRAEFERRYDAMPDLKRAELIEGEVYVSSPVRHRQHSKPHIQLGGWIGDLLRRHAGPGGGRQRQHPPGPRQRAPARRLPDDRAGARRAGPDQRGRLRRGCPRAGRRGRRQQRQLRPGEEAARLPSQRGPRIHRLAGAGSRGRTGSCSAKGVTSRWPRAPTASCAARSSPGSGSTRPRRCAATWRRSWPWSGRAWPRRSMRPGRKKKKKKKKKRGAPGGGARPGAEPSARRPGTPRIGHVIALDAAARDDLGGQGRLPPAAPISEAPRGHPQVGIAARVHPPEGRTGTRCRRRGGRGHRRAGPRLTRGQPIGQPGFGPRPGRSWG